VTPRSLEAALAQVPAELKARPQWATHIDKVPKNPATGNNAASDNPSTCSTYEQALEGAARYGHDGASYLCTDGDPYTGVNLDHCRNAETGAIESWGKSIIDDLGSYTEISLSGTGVHIIVRGTLPPGGRAVRVTSYSWIPAPCQAVTAGLRCRDPSTIRRERSRRQ
jgi:primase-polymerase (primpol)-like protein